jgi:NAD(P)-dependent dehydrogenase (short-subunit alcohol dehydrogenase family)
VPGQDGRIRVGERRVADDLPHEPDARDDRQEQSGAFGVVRAVPNDVGRLGRPEEIAAGVAYLASPVADYVSGATVRVDGGTIRSVI